MEVQRDHVPREFTGMARRFLNEVVVADAKFLKSSDRLVRELRERLRVKPVLRRDRVYSYKVRWAALADDFCLGSTVMGSHKALRFFQMRVRPLKYRDGAWDDQGRETGIAIAFTEIFTLRPDRRAVHLESTIRAAVTLHALGRWFQRSPLTSNADLISELRLLLRELPRSIDRNRIAGLGGEWRGKRRMMISTHKTVNAFCAQTFVDYDSITDEGMFRTKHTSMVS